MSVVLSGLLAAVLRTATPILLAGLGGLITQQAGVFNIALEGFMLTGAFAAVALAHLWGNSLLALLAGALISCVMAGVFALAVLRFRADSIIAGIGINLLASGLTTYLMRVWLGSVGSFTSDRVTGLPTLTLPVIKTLPFLGRVLSGHTPLVYFALILVPVVSFSLYRTSLGMNLRAVGEHPDAARTAGLRVNAYRTAAILLSGFFSGLAGAHLSLGYVTLFSEDMTAGRGFVAFTAVVFGGARPVLVLAASWLFGLAEAVTFRVQQFGVPPALVLMLPYLVTIGALLARMIMEDHRKKAPKAASGFPEPVADCHQV